MKLGKLMSRKDIALWLSEKREESVSATQVRDNEIRWGLKACRVPDLNARVVRYDAAKVLKALAKLF